MLQQVLLSTIIPYTQLTCVFITVCTFGSTCTELIVQEVEQDGNEDSYFTGIETTNGSIRVPTELVRMMGNGTGPVTVASVYYRNMSGLLPGTLPGERDTVLASPVISTSLQCGDKICDTANIQLSQPVIVTLKHFSQLAQVSW